MNGERKRIQEDEIDLVKLAHVVWLKRKFIIKVTGISALLGLVIAFTSKTEYIASTKILSEIRAISPSSLGGLSGLAGLAGVNIGSLSKNKGVLNPQIFPEIVSSEPFINKLINSPVYYEKLDTIISTFHYLKEFDKPSLIGVIGEFTIGLPGKLIGLYFDKKTTSRNSSKMTRYSKEDWRIIEAFSDRLSVEEDSETGVISLSVEIPDVVATAQIAQVMVDELTKYITNYEIEKSKMNLEVIQEQFNSAKKEYEIKQNQVARFADHNRNMTNPLIRVEYKRLQNEMNIAFEVYRSLASQFEQAKIRVVEKTPVFTVLEPVRIPEDKDKPKRLMIVLVFSFLGGALSTGYVIVKRNIIAEK